MLAGGNRLQRRRVVDAVRRDIGDRIELAPGKRILERKEMIGDAVFGAEGREPFRNDIDAADDADAFDRLEACGVLIGHAAGAENE